MRLTQPIPFRSLHCLLIATIIKWYLDLCLWNELVKYKSKYACWLCIWEDVWASIHQLFINDFQTDTILIFIQSNVWYDLFWTILHSLNVAWFETEKCQENIFFFYFLTVHAVEMWFFFFIWNSDYSIYLFWKHDL